LRTDTNKLGISRWQIRIAALRSRKLGYSVVIAFAAALWTARAIASVVNLTQSDQTVVLPSRDSHKLAGYFTPPYRPGPMPPQVNEILLRNAPSELRMACAAMVNSWGPRARGSERVTVRILALTNGSAWTTYRCDSRLPQFANIYSERLAAFSAARGTIQFIDLAAADDTRATLYHVGLAETLKLLGADNSASFEVFAVNSNPLAGAQYEASPSEFSGASTPRVSSENRLVIVANSASETKVALMLVTARVRPGANSRETSSADSAEYRAQARFDHDVAGHLTFVSVYHRDSPPGARPHFGLTRYAWDTATMTFVPAKPVRLPPVAPRRLPPVPPGAQLAN
jgi:hypothetical protein